jgi:hypothetical protein
LSEIILETFLDIINKDKNLSSIKEKKENGSIIEILGLPSAQSLSIRLGNTIEDCFKEFSIRMGAEIISDTILDNRQADSYFEFDDCSYYFEIKNNVNLDTEKTKAVIEKITEAKKIVDVSGCVSFRSKNKDGLKRFAKPSLREHLYGYNDYFNIFEENLTDKEYKIIIDCIREIFIKGTK